ncbi:MAG: DUF2155 domain-containing protein [Alphaproteobacteria bacterium]|nr:DUF2155 domain-containing protein [Alphaproteobacteria bacterium]
MSGLAPGLAGVALALAAVVHAGPAAAAVDRPRDVARLGTLEKVTARVSHLDVPVGATKRFNTLEITVESCFEAAPTEPPESAAYLTIVDRVSGAAAEEVFAGWMFASSPALSALQHAVYDVWVVDCLSAEEAGAEADQAPEPRDDIAPPRRRPEG